ncbi:unnamed protein product [Arctogadus glacialis]
MAERSSQESPRCPWPGSCLSGWHPSNQVLLRASWEPPDHGAAPPVTARFDPTTPGLRTPTVSLWPPE